MRDPHAAHQSDDADNSTSAEPPAADDPSPNPPGVATRRQSRRSATPTSLALNLTLNPTHDDATHKPLAPVTVARWSAAAQTQLSTLRKILSQRTPRQDIPTVSLRTRLELADETSERIDQRVGLASPQAIVLWTRTSPPRCREALNDEVLGWLINDVAPHMPEGEATTCVERLKRLARERAAIETTARAPSAYQWTTSQSHTAKAGTPETYADLADAVARTLEGRPVFPDLGGLRRIVGADLSSNQAELMTEPIDLGGGNCFSLVVRIVVLSYPGRPLPVVWVDFTRRVWARGLKTRSGGKGKVHGYAFPDGSSRAIRFTLRRIRRPDATSGGKMDGTGKQKGQGDSLVDYAPLDDFAPLVRRYFAGLAPSVATMLTGGHRLAGCKALIGLRHGVAERAPVKSGVPDRDKFDAFDRIAEELSAIGLHPWMGVEQVPTRARRLVDHNQHWDKRTSVKETERKKHATWLRKAQESVRACYGAAHHLVIAVQPDVAVEADALEAERRLREILGDSVQITRIPLPHNVHGPRNALPGGDKKPGERAALRMDAWAPFIETVRRYQARSGQAVDGALVIAHEWYPDERHDDNVNTHAGRIALATGLGVPAQYLRPRGEGMSNRRRRGRDGEGMRVADQAAQAQSKVDEDFETRLMNAWLDLAYRSQGRVLPEKLRQFSLESEPTTDADPDRIPDRILALSVLRRNTTTYLRNDQSFVPCAVELDVASGLCFASFAYEDSDTHLPASTDLLPLPQALVALARSGPVRWPSAQPDRKRAMEERTQRFFHERLADFNRRSERPLVLIDAESCRGVWPWLTDVRLDPENVQLAGSYNAQVAWPHAQIVRIRANNSPKILWDNEYFGVTIDTREHRRYRAPIRAEAQLFRLTDTQGTHVYLSFGSEIRTGLIQGASSYRTIEGIKPNGLARRLPPFTHAWATPAGVEICVVRANGEDPDQVARLVEWLRQCYAHFGAWTAKPAPLFFERVLKEYIADFDLDDEESEASQEPE